ncbi:MULTISPECIES: hypothetical protein [unclassified Devosia]|jgi:hypothetical protein|uniref:hypothetical protein n=1 Tax=unclassified Devosia TaxID=196773 RepID=UPI00086D69E8|nr:MULTISPECIES: hypothetical protein [unclassified Devosia]MBN9360196.1 hypothetical protein [Devosia sp.]ODS87756.1 MAG: hypothetical protein ABS47_11480 [Devosia sp. SCN 66-27]OJX22236.1 MAG: hypothetical protein BGO83_15410 [Devosia sp. 66-14]
MELLFLLLLIPVAWLLLLPGRIAKRARKYRFTGAGILLGALVAGWVGVQAMSKPPVEAVDYAAGDSDLRAILLQPETAPRYSFRD